MQRGRRHLMFGLGAVVVAAPVCWAASRPAALRLSAFDSTDNALRTLSGLIRQPAQTRGAWDLAQVLHHAAQSIEYSLQGFPSLHAPWFRQTIGPIAANVFSARGGMSHTLDEPIPGAPPIEAGRPLGAAVERAMRALLAFEQHEGQLQPHFAYGVLSKADYRRAHLMHLANHWDEVVA